MTVMVSQNALVINHFHSFKRTFLLNEAKGLITLVIIVAVLSAIYFLDVLFYEAEEGTLYTYSILEKE